MIQRRKPAKRLFSGLVGRPVELDDTPVPAPTPVETPPTVKKSPSAIRSERYRQRQKENPKFAKSKK